MSLIFQTLENGRGVWWVKQLLVETNTLLIILSGVKSPPVRNEVDNWLLKEPDVY